MASGEENSMVDPKESKAPVLIGIVMLLLVISTMMVGLRIFSRRLVKQFTLDDFTAIISWACIMACGISQMAMTSYGLGRHEWTLSEDDLLLYRRCFWISILLYMVGLFWIKMTFLLHYWRLMAVSNMRNFCLAALIIIGLWGGSQGIMVFLQCIPLKAVWDPSVKDAICIPNITTWWFFNAIFNIVSDIAIILLPLPGIWRLRLPRSQKIYLVGVFVLGFFTVGVSMMRLQWLKPQPDQTWWNVTAALWSLAEMTSAISCACLPFFRPLVLRILPHSSISQQTERPGPIDGRDGTVDLESQGIIYMSGQSSQDHKLMVSVDSGTTAVESANRG